MTDATEHRAARWGLAEMAAIVVGNMIGFACVNGFMWLIGSNARWGWH